MRSGRHGGGGVRELGLDVLRIDGEGTLDGGDVLQIGTTVYVGRGGRTNAEGIRQLRAHLLPLGRTVVPVGLRAVLHLKSAVTALPDGSFLALPDLLDRASSAPPGRSRRRPAATWCRSVPPTC